MANISFVLVLLLSLALPFPTVLGFSSWDNVLSQAHQAGLSAEDVEKAKKAIDNGQGSAPSLWDDFVKHKGSKIGSSANAPVVEPLLEADIVEAPNEAPRASAAHAGHAPTPSVPKATPPKAQAYAPLGQAPSASRAEAATPKAQAPLGEAPSASASAPQAEAATPKAQAPSASTPKAATSEAQAPKAPTPQAN